MSPAHHPLASIGTTLATGAAAGLVVFTGAVWLNPEAAAAAFDWLGDGLGLADALVPAWLLGHAALVVHHVLPGIAGA